MIVAKIDLEGMQELLEKVNKLGLKGEVIKKKAPRSALGKKHMADNIKISDIEKEDGVDFVKIGPNKGGNSEF